jgi:hypothetical protein
VIMPRREGGVGGGFEVVCGHGDRIPFRRGAVVGEGGA